jgi:REP element-mobilizing transposase RayT
LKKPYKPPVFFLFLTPQVHSGTDPIVHFFLSFLCLAIYFFVSLQQKLKNCMPRKQREKSGTGIYHVMMRGINHQDIFEDRGDYWKFLKLLRMQTHPEDNAGKPLPAHCIVYAYCLMSNHVHLLLRELEEGLVPPIKSIAISYAQYFNYKYEHSGQVFQDRFKSEPVNDMAYFLTLMRYIHQNPVAAGITSSVGSYTWSSWCEYDETKTCAVPVCNTQHVLNRITGKELAELVNDLLPKALNILDFDNETEQRISDEKLRQFLSELMGGTSASTLQHYKKEERNRIIKQLKDFGASIRQISRLTGVSFGVIRNIR